MASGASDLSELLQVDASELKFPFKLNKQITSTLKLINSNEFYVAFKVKTTSPRKYSVRPNTGVLLPRSTSEITVTMQAQHEQPADPQCKDKFLVQSVVAPDGFTAGDINQEMFTKDSGNELFETKLRVVYVFPDNDHNTASNGDAYRDDAKDSAALKAKIQEVNAALTTVSEERNAAVGLSQRLQQELSTMNRRKLERQTGYSFLVVLLVGLLGILIGFLIS